MNHQVLQQNDEAAFGRADCEKQIDHSHNRAVASQHEDAPAARLFENEPQTTKLFVLVRPKIAFLSEQSAQHFRQLVQVGLGRWFDYDMFAHRFYCLSQSRTRWQSPNQRSTVAARGAIDSSFLTPSVTALKSGRSYFPVLWNALTSHPNEHADVSTASVPGCVPEAGAQPSHAGDSAVANACSRKASSDITSVTPRLDRFFC